jgi:hypothetical protein
VSDAARIAELEELLECSRAEATKWQKRCEQLQEVLAGTPCRDPRYIDVHTQVLIEQTRDLITILKGPP